MTETQKVLQVLVQQRWNDSLICNAILEVPAKNLRQQLPVRGKRDSVLCNLGSKFVMLTHKLVEHGGGGRDSLVRVGKVHFSLR